MWPVPATNIAPRRPKEATVARIELPAATRDLEVRLHDPEKDAKRIYKPRVLTRSVKRQLAEGQARIVEASDAIPEDGLATVEQEEAIMRASCDLVTLLLTGADDAPKAGDLLYDQWASEQITDDQVLGLLEQLSETTTDPT